MSRRTTWFVVIIALVVIVLGLRYTQSITGPAKSREYAPQNVVPGSGEGDLINTTTYADRAGKTITAAFYHGPPAWEPKPGEPSTPTGFVELTLADGSTLKLRQTISADGARYANNNQSFVFWDKGTTALVFDNGKQIDYTNRPPSR
jgi:Membrane-bound lysozyme-inhibitor of c-type lysozyme